MSYARTSGLVHRLNAKVISLKARCFGGQCRHCLKYAEGNLDSVFFSFSEAEEAAGAGKRLRCNFGFLITNEWADRYPDTGPCFLYGIVTRVQLIEDNVNIPRARRDIFDERKIGRGKFDSATPLLSNCLTSQLINLLTKS